MKRVCSQSLRKDVDLFLLNASKLFDALRFVMLMIKFLCILMFRTRAGILKFREDIGMDSRQLDLCNFYEGLDLQGNKSPYMMYKAVTNLK